VKLNDAQLACVSARDGVWVVIAGPGSGKTSTLIERFLMMLLNQIPQDDILNLTFTSSAAENMLAKAGIKDVKSVFRTFHSFALQIIDREREYLGFDLCDTIIPVELQNYQLLFDLVKIYQGAGSWETLQAKISEWKRNGVSPSQALEECAHLREEYYQALAYRDYEIKCREQGWLDFDSVMQEAVRILGEHEDARRRWQRKYICVDECQDTDIVQFKLLQLIFSGNIFVVGDENQLIYEWRSAQSGNLTNFARHFPGAQTLYLGQNYRSTKRLVAFLLRILPVDNGLSSKMFTENDEGTDPTITKYLDEYEESENVLVEAAKDPTKSAVIARTNRQLFRYQKACAIKGIKYKFLGKKDFWQQPEVEKLLGWAKKANPPLTVPADEVLKQIIRDKRLMEIYGRTTRKMESSPVENLNDIVKMAAKKGNLPEFLDWLRRVTYARQNVKGLTLSTVHQSKGKEWDRVFLIGATQGILPHDDGELHEEHRIFFVGCSRAAKELHISFYRSPSMFIPDEDKARIVVFGETGNDNSSQEPSN
jgi:DNA helicase II / ATP-dependent DNA helicase PcrA